MAIFKDNSRYKGSTVTTVLYKEEQRTYVLLKKPLVVNETDQDIFIKIDQEVEFRPDLVSTIVYDTPDYGWAILEINELRNFRDLVSGTSLRIPPLTAVQAAIEATHDL